MKLGFKKLVASAIAVLMVASAMTGCGTTYTHRENDPDVPGRPVELGDIVLNLSRARSQGEEFGHGFAREAAFLVIHSTLHLLGYDHETGEEDEADMRARQSSIAEICGFGLKNTTEVK